MPEAAITIDVDDPGADDVRALLDRHLAFAYEVTPPGHVHALDVDRLRDPAVTFFSARRADDGAVVGVAALRELDDDGHAEVKSMHVAHEARGAGIAQALLDHVVAEARRRGWTRLSLETGTYPAFDPARRLYERNGFTPCPPFADYTDNPSSTCMTREL